jgi:hypothetical protein
MKIHVLLLLVSGASACHLPNPSPPDPGREAASSTSAPSSEAKPVVRDASLVVADTPGTIRMVDGPLREVDGVTSGRAWLLERYQTVLTEKTELERQLEASDADREKIRGAHESLIAEHTKTLARSTELEGRVRELETQTLALARRLAESEIARLEIQKADLEREAKNDRMERPR